MSPSITSATDTAREWLAFPVGDEEYAVDVLRVQEIRSYERPTRLAHAPAHVDGVINLRGNVVPVIDLRAKLGLPRKASDGACVTIVLRLPCGTVGMAVEGVTDVVNLCQRDQRAVPPLGHGVAGEYLHAIGVLDARTLILVDAEKLVGDSVSADPAGN